MNHRTGVDSPYPLPSHLSVPQHRSMSMLSWGGAKAVCRQTCSRARGLGDDHLKTALWQEFMSDHPAQNNLHFLIAHIYVLDHRSVEQSCRNISPTAFLLQVIEALEDDSFPVGEPVSDVWKIVARITGRHMKVSLRRAY